MVAVVSLQELVDELIVVTDEHHIFLNKATGKIITLTDEDISIAENGEYTEEQQDWQLDIFEQAKEVLSSGNYLELPNRFDIHEFAIMEKFCLEFPEERIGDELLDKIRGGSGAFHRFKDTIYRYGIEKDWFKFQNEAYKEIVTSTTDG
jgi:hypothetical protein